MFVLQPGVHSLVTSPSPSLGDNLGLFQRKNSLVSRLDVGGNQCTGTSKVGVLLNLPHGEGLVKTMV